MLANKNSRNPLLAWVIASSLSLFAAETLAQSCVPQQPAAQTIAESNATGTELLGLARESLRRADELQQESRQLIRRSQAVREQIKSELATTKRKSVAKNDSAGQLTQPTLLEQSRELQTRGSALRTESSAIKKTASVQFAVGLRELFPQWLADGEPICASTLDGSSINSTPLLGAHNTAQRTTHPSKKALAGSPQTVSTDNMSLQLPQMAAQQLPENVDTSAFAVSREGQYIAHLAVAADGAAAPHNKIVINQLHAWYLVVTDMYGQPQPNIELTFSGHMPGHVHGLPTQPRVTNKPAAGVYLLEGIKFQMPGWWVIDLDINQGNDNLRFNLKL